MIWAALFLVITEILEQLIKIFPLADQDIVTAISAYVGDMKTIINVANFIIDVEMFYNFLGIIIGIEMIMWAFKVVRFVASSLPFSPLGGSR